MRKQFIIISVLIMAFVINSSAQSIADSVLASIARNNKTIQANEQYWDAKKIEYKAGNTPYDLTVEYDYLIGSSQGSGNQTEVEVVQSFDFPFTYIKRKQLANEQITQTEFQQLSKRQDILLEAKMVCIELVYYNKLHHQLVYQKSNTEKLLQDFQAKLDKGEGNMLDVNKARLQLLDVKKQYEQNVSATIQLNTKLTELNGGMVISFPDTIYPALPNIPSFEEVEQEYEKNDPLRKILEQEQNIAQKRVEVSRSLWLPKIEAGYRYVKTTGQIFNGVHTGITLPLWANKNMVKQQRAKLLYSDLELQDHLNEHYYEIKSLYDRYENLKGTLADYKNAFSSLNNAALLNKALAVGHISTIEYFMEMNYYNEAINSFLQAEMEYYAVIAELHKYQL